jgi:hypothetical protein
MRGGSSGKSESSSSSRDGDLEESPTPPRFHPSRQARAKVRALAIIESSLRGQRSQPGKGELDKLLDAVRTNKRW